MKVDVSKAVSRPLVPSKVCCVTSFWSLVFAGVVESLSLESELLSALSTVNDESRLRPIDASELYEFEPVSLIEETRSTS